MTTEHNRRSTDLLALEITKRGFIIERQEKEINRLNKLINDVFVPMVNDLCVDLELEILNRYEHRGIDKYPSQKAKFDRDNEIVMRARMIIAALPPATPKGE